MEVGESNYLAASLTVSSVRLLRWLKGLDAEPAFTGSEASAMSIVVEFGSVTPKQISDIDGVKKPSTSRVLKRLEERGLIKKTEEAETGQQYQVSATPEGQALWFQAHLKKVAPLSRRLANLSDQERRTIADFLNIFENITDPNALEDRLY